MKKIFKVQKVNIRKGDEVLVICGKDKGKKGVVKSFSLKKMSVVVDGVNKFKKAVKVGQNGGENFLFKERPLYISKVKVVKKTQKGYHKADKKEVKG